MALVLFLVLLVVVAVAVGYVWYLTKGSEGRE
jgi:hypothetical protein